MFSLKYLFRFTCLSVQCHSSLANVKHFSKVSAVAMKYLNVAEKNDAAKSIAGLLSGGSARRTEGLSPYNKIYSFNINFKGAPTEMVMTSVSGHLMQQDFLDAYRGWQLCDPISLFDAPVVKYCPQNYLKIKQTLEREVNQLHSKWSATIDIDNVWCVLFSF